MNSSYMGLEKSYDQAPPESPQQQNFMLEENSEYNPQQQVPIYNKLTIPSGQSSKKKTASPTMKKKVAKSRFQ